jgi:hypothetical protein
MGTWNQAHPELRWIGLDPRRSCDLDFFTSETVDGMALRNQVIRWAEFISAAWVMVLTILDFHRFQRQRGAGRAVLDCVADGVPPWAS